MVEERYRFDSVKFDTEGNLVGIRDGKPVEPDKRPLADIIGDGKVVKAESITVLTVEGSCYRLVPCCGGWIWVPC